MIETLIVIAFGLGILGCLLFLRSLAQPAYQGPVSDHFDGKRFYNPEIDPRSLKDLVKWTMTRKATPWPKKREVVHHPEPKERVHHLSVLFINHATLLIQWNGYNILTDPIWSARASPLSWIGPKRFHPPGIAFNKLPPIDLVLISHNHYDSLDLPTLKRLNETHHPLFLVGLGIKDYLRKRGIHNVQELDWWQQAELPFDFDAFFTPAQHFSARGLFDRDQTLWGGFALIKDSDFVYFSGDTAYSSVFKQVRERFGTPRLSMLPIGAYEPRWFMRPAHMSPDEAVQAHLDLGSKQSLAYHFGTFRLSDEGIHDPPIALTKALEHFKVPIDQFWVLEPGQSKNVP